MSKKIDHLPDEFTNLERAQSRSEDKDIAGMITKFRAIQVKAHIQPQLIKNGEDTYIHLADLLENIARAVIVWGW